MVVALVERLEHKTHAEHIPGGEILASNVTWLGVIAPERFDRMLMIVGQGHPRIGERPLLLGDTLTFVLPKSWRGRELALEELEGLAFTK